MCGSGLDITSEVTDIYVVNTSSDSVNKTDSTQLYDGLDYQSGSQVLAVLIPTVEALGLCGNVVVLVVWNAETTFNPTTFSMKCLAVSDVTLLFFFLCTYARAYLTSASEKQHWSIPLFVGMLHYCRTVTVHIILGVVITRWVAVHKPLRADSLLTKRRLVVAYVLMLVWCLVPFILVSIAVKGIISSEGLRYMAVSEAVYLALPISLLVVFKVSLLYTLFSNRRSSSLGQQQQQHAARAARSSQFKYLVGAVLCLNITTVLAYTVSIAFRSVVFQNLDYSIQVCPHFCFLFMSRLCVLLEVFNSSINVVYYLVFVSRFRQLCRLRCWSCWRCCRCRRSSEYVTGSVTVTLEAVQTEVVECSHLSTHDLHRPSLSSSSSRS